MIEPLFVDKNLENRKRQTLEHRIARGIKYVCPCLYYEPPPVSRFSVLAQLRKRNRNDVLRKWNANLNNDGLIMRILKSIERELFLPNHCLAPVDSLRIILDAGYLDDLEHLIFSFNEILKSDYSLEELREKATLGLTLGQFLEQECRSLS